MLNLLSLNWPSSKCLGTRAPFAEVGDNIVVLGNELDQLNALKLLKLPFTMLYFWGDDGGSSALLFLWHPKQSDPELLSLLDHISLGKCGSNGV